MKKKFLQTHSNHQMNMNDRKPLRTAVNVFNCLHQSLFKFINQNEEHCK